MTKLVVAFDLDGVVVDWYGEVLRHLPPEIHIPHDGIKTFYVEENYPEEHRAIIKDTIKRQGFYDAMKPMAGAIDTMNRIFDDERYHPFLCSSPETDSNHQSCWSEKARWVSRYLGERWLDRLMLVKDKSLAKADIIVDDKPEMFGHYLENDGVAWRRFVFSHNYNLGTQGVRVGWDNMEEELAKVHASLPLLTSDDVLRQLAAYLGNGGYNAPTVIPEVFLEKIMDGIKNAELNAAVIARLTATPDSI